MVNAEFIKGGKTDLILEDSKGNKTTYEIIIDYSSIDVSKK